MLKVWTAKSFGITIIITINYHYNTLETQKVNQPKKTYK